MSTEQAALLKKKAPILMASVTRGDCAPDSAELLEHAIYLEQYAEKAPSPELREARLVAADQLRKGVAS